MNKEDARIANALGTDEVPEVGEENLLTYRKYLLSHLDKSTVLTGREDFPWEEKYVFGDANMAEYERLKKTNPSYTDEFQLLDILKEELEENDLIASIIRLSDQKTFTIGLSWLTTKNKKNKDCLLLDDFATWVANWY
jgi:hypothetical protein